MSTFSRSFDVFFPLVQKELLLASYYNDLLSLISSHYIILCGFSDFNLVSYLTLKCSTNSSRTF